MKRHWLIFLIGLTLMSACGRSPNSQFYLLNPLSPHQKPTRNFSNLRLGINEIHYPAYLSKPELIVHYSPHQVKLEAYHRWAENLGKNTKRVIEANLSALLPGALIVSAPWDYKFKPDLRLQIDITQFEVSINGNSLLRADYFIYTGNKLITENSVFYQQKVAPVSIEKLVVSMNDNLNHFTQDLAKVFYQYAK